ncbi:hypothetical protein DMX06_08415 [Pseudomonas mosselii]|nr:hypothetical protein DMX06_08415 [Pseudomonas mosselii]
MGVWINNWPTAKSRTCRSGLVSRKGCKAAPGSQRCCKDRRGRFAALSRHKAAPTGWRSTCRSGFSREHRRSRCHPPSRLPRG